MHHIMRSRINLSATATLISKPAPVTANTCTGHSNNDPKGARQFDNKTFIRSPVQIKDVTGFLFPSRACAMDKHLAHVVFVMGSRLLLGEGCPMRRISPGATVEHKTI
jgi:hypothetical protein